MESKITLNGYFGFVGILLFLLPVSELFGSYHYTAGFRITLPNLINIALFVIAIYDILRRRSFPRNALVPVALIIFMIFMVYFHDIYESRLFYNQRLTTFIGLLVLVFGLSYWFMVHPKSTLYLGWGFGVLALMLFASLLFFQFFDIGRDFMGYELRVRAKTRINIPGLSITRNTGFTGFNMGTFGSYMEASLFFLLSLVLSAKIQRYRTLKVIFGLFLIFIIVSTGIIFTQSRSMVLAVVVGSGCYLFLFSIFVARWRRFWILLTGTIVIASFLIFPALVTYLISVDPGNVTTRQEHFYLSQELISKSPIMGNGFGAEQYLLGSPNIIHNHYLAIISPLELPIEILYIFISLTAVLSAMYSILKGKYVLFSIASLSAFMSVFVENNFYQGLTTPVIFVLLCMMISIPFLVQSNRKSLSYGN